MNDEMMKALEADGEKLRQMTGDDHGPIDLDHIHDGCAHEIERLQCALLRIRDLARGDLGKRAGELHDALDSIFAIAYANTRDIKGL